MSSNSIKKYEDQLTGIVASEQEWEEAYREFMLEHSELNNGLNMGWQKDLKQVDNDGRYK